MIRQSSETSPRVYARVAGLLYLVNIVVGFFAIGLVPAEIIETGNPVATAHNIQLHEPFYRLGLAAHIIILLTNIPLAVIFYHLFKVVNRRAARLVIFFTIVGTAIESVNLLNGFAPLVILDAARHGASFTPEQLQSLSYMMLQLGAIGFNLALVFFGCYGITIGWLIYKSSFLPSTIGVLMVIGGSCYFINSFANFLDPAFARNLSPYIQVPSGLAELAFCLWLLIAGVNKTKWREKASTRSAATVH